MQLDWSKFEAEMAFFKKGSPHIHAALAETRKNLDLVAAKVAGGTTPPPPPPPDPTPDPTPVPPNLTRITGTHGSLKITKPTFLDNVQAGYVEFVRGSEGSIMKGGRVGCSNVFGASNITFEGVTFNGGGNTPRNQVSDAGGGVPKNILFKNCSFRGYYMPDRAVHSEALFIGYSDGVVIDGCTFDDNGNTAHIFFTWWGESQNPNNRARNAKVQNCKFGITAYGGPSSGGAYFSINFREEYNGSENMYVQKGQPTVVTLSSRADFVK